MQVSAEQALVRIDIANAAQDLLIEQQRLYASAPRSDLSAEILRAYLERLSSQLPSEFRQFRFRDKQHSPKTPNVGVAQFAAIVEDKKAVRVGRNGFGGRNYGQLACHSKMDDEVERRRWSGIRATRLQRNADKFA